MTHFVSEIGGDGSGHERCWPACLASSMLDRGATDDPSVLRDRLASEIPNLERYGTTIDQAATQVKDHQWQYNTVVTWDDIRAQLGLGHDVALLVNNFYLVPTFYPNAAGWHALHWVRVLQRVDSGLWLLMDPLSWLPQPTGAPYEGLSLVTGTSLTRAIEVTPDDRAGIAIWVG